MTRPRLLLAAAVILVIIAAAAFLAGGRADPARQSHGIAARLQQAVDADDQAAFAGLFSNDAGPQRIAELWTNLRQLDVAEIQAVGDDWRVLWSVPGEQGRASHWLRPGWTCTRSGCLLDDLGQSPGKPAPIWLTGPVEVHKAGQTLLLAGPAAGEWVAAAADSASALREFGPGGLLHPVDVLVIEVPADTASFEQVMAAPAIDFHGTGAVTWLADSAGQVTDPATRIVINPDGTAQIDEQARTWLLLHEQVHAATGWLGAPAAGQLWVSEGLAEAVMLDAAPELQARSAELLAAGCPLAAAPPADADFSDPNAQGLAYASSAALVAALLQQPDGLSQIEDLWTHPGALPSSGLPDLCIR